MLRADLGGDGGQQGRSRKSIFGAMEIRATEQDDRRRAGQARGEQMVISR